MSFTQASIKKAQAAAQPNMNIFDTDMYKDEHDVDIVRNLLKKGYTPSEEYLVRCALRKYSETIRAICEENAFHVESEKNLSLIAVNENIRAILEQ